MSNDEFGLITRAAEILLREAEYIRIYHQPAYAPGEVGYDIAFKQYLDCMEAHLAIARVTRMVKS